MQPIPSPSSKLWCSSIGSWSVSVSSALPWCSTRSVLWRDGSWRIPWNTARSHASGYADSNSCGGCARTRARMRPFNMSLVRHRYGWPTKRSCRMPETGTRAEWKPSAKNRPKCPKCDKSNRWSLFWFGRWWDSLLACRSLAVLLKIAITRSLRYICNNFDI